jgi:hypothetical protein
MTASSAAFEAMKYYYISDLASMAQNWLSSGTGLTDDLFEDGMVDFKDFSVLAEGWVE